MIPLIDWANIKYKIIKYPFSSNDAEWYCNQEMRKGDCWNEESDIYSEAVCILFQSARLLI
jgi:hypothetical protein